MSVRPIRLVGDPVLRTPCDPIRTITDATRRLVRDLEDTVDDEARAGVAANPPAEMRFILRSFTPERASLPGAAPYFHAKALEAVIALSA